MAQQDPIWLSDFLSLVSEIETGEKTLPSIDCDEALQSGSSARPIDVQKIDVQKNVLPVRKRRKSWNILRRLRTKGRQQLFPILVGLTMFVLTLLVFTGPGWALIIVLFVLLGLGAQNSLK